MNISQWRRFSLTKGGGGGRLRSKNVNNLDVLCIPSKARNICSFKMAYMQMVQFLENLWAYYVLEISISVNVSFLSHYLCTNLFLFVIARGGNFPLLWNLLPFNVIANTFQLLHLLNVLYLYKKSGERSLWGITHYRLFRPNIQFLTKVYFIRRYPSIIKIQNNQMGKTCERVLKYQNRFFKSVSLHVCGNFE